MLSDGYGDAPPLEGLDPEEVALRFQKLAHRTAIDSGSINDHDDLFQEALLQVWRSAEQKPNLPATYYAKALRNRVRDVAWGGRPYTGGDSKPGPKSRPIENRVDWQDPASEDAFGLLLEAADLLAGVEWAYHQGEIVQALSGLPEADRNYVVQRFWHGATDTEIATKTGVSNKFLGNRWKRQIRPKLAETLAHLAL